MRVITAVYLHCRPELRDEWLSTNGTGGMGLGMGGHEGMGGGESEVEESLSVEWGWRGLTYWWLKRGWPEEMRLRDGRVGPSQTQSRKEKSEAADSEEGVGEFDALETLQEIDDDERDFFQRELDLLGWGIAGLMSAGEDVAFGEEAPGANGAVNGGGMGGMGVGEGGMGTGGDGEMGSEISGIGSGSDSVGVGRVGDDVGRNAAAAAGRFGWETANLGTIEAWQNEQ